MEENKNEIIYIIKSNKRKLFKLAPNKEDERREKRKQNCFPSLRA